MSSGNTSPPDRKHRCGCSRPLRRGSPGAIAHATAAAALLLHVGIACAQAPAAWDARYYNPKAKPDDVVLPMPCGGAIAFRRILIPSTGVLDDKRVQLGGPDARFSYLENTRSDYVAGGFSDAKLKGQRYYLLGKYEVTRSQYDAVTSGNCAAPTTEGRMPKTGVTWGESVAFTERYSIWLAANAAGKVPAELGVPGFVRLPTEAEWEFAARGGIAVDGAVFEQPIFPVPEGGAAKYIWYGGNESSNNELNVIGLLLPNPLGLHDILGNASEFVLDPFHLNKHTHLHGQAGGYTIKGGDFRTRLADMRAAARAEYVPAGKDGPVRSDSTGFRVALVAPALPNRQRIGEVESAWTTAGQAAIDPAKAPAPAAGPVSADPVQEVDTLAKAMTDPALKQRLSAIGTVLKANNEALNEQRDRSAKAQLQVGTYVARIIGRDARVVDALSSKTSPAATAYQATIDGNMNYFADTVRQLALDFSVNAVQQQGEVLKREYEARGRPEYVPLVTLVVDYVRRSRSGQAIDKAALRRELVKN